MSLRGPVVPIVPPDVQGDREFEVLYAQHFGFVWRCLRGLGVPEEGLDDAAQDVFVIAHKRLAEFRGDSSIRTWLYGIVRNLASNLRRAQRRRGQQLELARDAIALGPSPLEQAQDREAAQFVLRFLEATSAKKRDVFVLALLEGMSIPEVAGTLAIPLNTAYTRLRKVKLEFTGELARARAKSELGQKRGGR